VVKVTAGAEAATGMGRRMRKTMVEAVAEAVATESRLEVA
jgi:hypothetical protein